MLRQWKRSCDQSFKWAQARVWDRCHPPDVCEALRRAVQPGRIGQNMPEPSKSASIDALPALAKPERLQLPLKEIHRHAVETGLGRCGAHDIDFLLTHVLWIQNETTGFDEPSSTDSEETWKDQVFCNFSWFILFLHVIFMSFSFANHIWSLFGRNHFEVVELPEIDHGSSYHSTSF